MDYRSTKLYYVISVSVAKAISLIKNLWIRYSIVAAVCLGFLSLTQFPIYGGGGHDPVQLYTLSGLIAETYKTYGSGTFQIVYEITIILLIGNLSFPILSKRREQKTTEKMLK